MHLMHFFIAANIHIQAHIYVCLYVYICCNKKCISINWRDTTNVTNTIINVT